MHAHWLPPGSRRSRPGPFVLQLWGTDVELARRAPWAFRWLVRRARLAIVASEYRPMLRELALATCASSRAASRFRRRSGARRSAARALWPPLAREGIHFLAATERLPRVIVGAGPVDVPEAVGFVPHTELGPYYERAAVVCVPSRREGYGVVAREAMAHGRPVVATAVGGLVDVTGVLVPPDDVARLREVLEAAR